MNEKMLELAASAIGAAIETVKDNCKRVDELDAWYFWSPERGGKAVIVDASGEKLAATSAISFEKHIEEFKNGRRN